MLGLLLTMLLFLLLALADSAPGKLGGNSTCMPNTMRGQHTEFASIM